MIAAFFDIDGTIYRSSLIIEHFKKLIKSELVDVSQYNNKVKESFTLWDERKGDYDDYLLDLADTYRESIKGLPVHYIDFISEQVIGQKGNKVYKFSRDRIAWHKENGHKVILISGSPDFLVSKMAKKVGADDFIGSVYGVANNKLTGDVSPMWDTPNKIKSIHKFCEKYDIDLEKSFAYGDTNGDFGMLAIVGNPFAINPSRELIENIKKDTGLAKRCEIIVERKDVIYHMELKNIEIE
ncbi:MAG: HAD family hydrolase [Fusobacteriaceae bacterium]